MRDINMRKSRANHASANVSAAQIIMIAEYSVEYPLLLLQE
jgi:hypothetical protein